LITAIHLEALSLTRGDRTLFENLSFGVAGGEAVALLGANGAGKTSLLRAIAGFIRPAGGAIRFDGAEEAADARREGMHFLGHQDGLKPTRTAWEELLFQVQWTGGTTQSAKGAVETLGLGPLLDLEIRKLSAGQRRRVALGRLIASPRPLWLLDEPLSPLDAARRQAFGGLMQAHLDGGGIILAAVHDPLPIKARAVEIGG